MNRTLLILAGALFFGGLFVVHLYREAYIADETGGTPIPVLVAFIDIPIGVPVRDEWLAIREIPEAYVEDRHITVEMRREIVGLPLAQAVNTGEALLRTDLSPLSDARRTLSSAVPPGMRAITLPTTRNSTHVGLLQPGDRVDVLLSVGEFGNPQAGRGVVVLENVLVLAYGLEVHRERTSSGTTSTVEASTNVTLQVSIDEGALLTQARAPGAWIQLILRNPNDSAVATSRIPDVTWADMLEMERRARFLHVAVRSLIPVLPPPVIDPAEAERGLGATASSALVPALGGGAGPDGDARAPRSVLPGLPGTLSPPGATTSP
jgi:pilus assembly protein CpaB